MMQQQSSNQAVLNRKDSLLSTHRVLRSTYFLLSMTLLFSAFTAWFAMKTHLSFNVFVTIIGIFGLYFLTVSTRNSPWGILSIFAFTGFMGLMLAPILTNYLSVYANGGEIIMMALGSTGLIFFGLSGYVLTTRKNMSFLGGFLFTGLIVVIVASLANLFFHMPALQLAISSVCVFIFSGLILYDTSRIINGGETNYIMATISLYLDLFNLFTSLLNILGALMGNRN